MFKLTKYLVKLEHERRIILINKNIGSWIKMSLESYHIIREAIDRKLTREQLLDAFEDDEDRQYFKQLLCLLEQRAIILLDKNSEEVDIEDISIDFTNRCNLNCIHCMAEANREEEQEELNTVEYKILIDKVLSVHPGGIIISGGEPMVRADFMELCDYIRRTYEGNLSLMTNGTLIDEKNVKLLVKHFDHISISLDGIDEESSSILRGSGVFERAMKGICLLKNNGFTNIADSIVETKLNEHLIPQFIELCKKMDIQPMVRAFAAMGRGEKVKSKLLVRTDYCPDLNLLDEYLSVPVEAFESHSISGVCSSAINSFYIDAYGNIYPCAPLNSPEYFYGNIKNISDFKNYIEKKEYESTSGYRAFSALFPEKDEICSACEVNTFCWHCIFQHSQKKMNDPNFEMWCKMQKKELSSIWYEG